MFSISWLVERVVSVRMWCSRNWTMFGRERESRKDGFRVSNSWKKLHKLKFQTFSALFIYSLVSITHVFFFSNAISLKRVGKRYAYLNSGHSHCEALRCDELRDEIGFSALCQSGWQRVFRSVTREIRHYHVGRTADRPSGNLNFSDLRRILEGNS